MAYGRERPTQAIEGLHELHKALVSRAKMASADAAPLLGVPGFPVLRGVEPFALFLIADAKADRFVHHEEDSQRQ